MKKKIPVRRLADKENLLKKVLPVYEFPDKFIIGGIQMPIVWKEQIETGNVVRGAAFAPGIIEMMSNCTNGMKMSVLLHEAIHFITDHYGIEIPETPAAEERMIDQLSTAFFEFIQNNPEFIQQIIKYREVGE